MADSPEVIEARENKNNRDYFKNIVKKNPLLIEWASDEIRDDKDIILEAVKIDGQVAMLVQDF